MRTAKGPRRRRKGHKKSSGNTAYSSRQKSNERCTKWRKKKAGNRREWRWRNMKDMNQEGQSGPHQRETAVEKYQPRVQV